MMTAVAQKVVTDLLFCNNFPTFVVTIDKEMETSIIRIGNSRGIIIPAPILKKLGVKDNAKVQLEEKEEGVITLRFSPVEEAFTGPFTGPFKALAPYQDMEDPWGGEDAAEYVRKLRDSTGKEKRYIPEL